MKRHAGIAIGTGLIVVGLVLGYIPFGQRVQNDPATVVSSPFSHKADAHPATKEQSTPHIQGKPTHLQVPRLSIDLPVIDGYYNKHSKQWTLSNSKAHFATITAQPNNQAGNTFIYGHNRREVFAALHNIKVGDEIIINTDNGYRFTYRFRSSYETNPNDSSAFSYQGLPILTVQTCSGLLYQNRQMFVFDYVSVIRP